VLLGEEVTEGDAFDRHAPSLEHHHYP
jgi:hypothetical protein